MLEIKIKYFDKNIPQDQKIGKIAHGDWIDLRSAEDISLLPFEYHQIKLGIAIQLPPDHEAHIKPRSSTFKTWGIIQVNSVATIDESYCGDNDQWMMPVVALPRTVSQLLLYPLAKIFPFLKKNLSTHIKKGDRVCQFAIVRKMPEITVTEVHSMDNADRGGFGTTGKK